MAADPTTAPPPVSEAPAPPRIIIEFAGPGAAMHVVKLDRVDPAQVYAAAFVLDCVARELRSGSLIQEVLGPGGMGAGLDLSKVLGSLRG